MDHSSTQVKPKALQLGVDKHSHGTSFASAFPPDLEKEIASEAKSAWANDLMDVNADADDWSKWVSRKRTILIRLIFTTAAYESASVPVNTDDAWGDMLESEEPTSPISMSPSLAPRTISNLSTGSTIDTPSNPPRLATTSAIEEVSKPTSISLVSDASGLVDETPHPAPATTPAAISMVGMSKEEKAAEMARRREERKQVRSR